MLSFVLEVRMYTKNKFEERMNGWSSMVERDSVDLQIKELEIVMI